MLVDGVHPHHFCWLKKSYSKSVDLAAAVLFGGGEAACAYGRGVALDWVDDLAVEQGAEFVVGVAGDKVPDTAEAIASTD